MKTKEPYYGCHCEDCIKKILIPVPEKMVIQDLKLTGFDPVDSLGYEIDQRFDAVVDKINSIIDYLENRSTK